MQSVSIIMSYRTILWIVGGLTVINILLLVLSYWQKSPILNFLHFIFTSVAVSIIYGMYYEVIEQRYSSIKEIFSKFSVGYLVLSFLIFIPVIIFMIFATFIKPLEQYYLLFKDTLTISTVLLTIYVIPYYYISNNIVSSILKGINFNIKNVYLTSPIIGLVFIFEIIKILIQDYLFSVNMIYK